MAKTRTELDVAEKYIETMRQDLEVLLISVPGLENDHRKWTILTQAAKIGVMVDNVYSVLLSIRANERDAEEG